MAAPKKTNAGPWKPGKQGSVKPPYKQNPKTRAGGPTRLVTGAAAANARLPGGGAKLGNSGKNPVGADAVIKRLPAGKGTMNPLKQAMSSIPTSGASGTGTRTKRISQPPARPTRPSGPNAARRGR